MDSKTFFDNFEIIANAPGGVARLRELILDLAVTGRIKRVSSWTNGCLDDFVSESITDGDWIESKDQDPQGEIRLLQLADVGHGTFKDKSFKFVNRSTFNRLKCTLLRKNDVMIARLPDPIGRACLYPGFSQECITVVDVAIVRTDDKLLLPDYLVVIMNSPSMRARIVSLAAGTTRLRIATGKIRRMPIVIPTSIAEQVDIVRTVNDLLALCDELESAQSQRNLIRAAVRRSAIDSIAIAATPDDLNTAWKRIGDNWTIIADTPESISSLRMLILDLAMKGKLVPSSTEWRECLLGEITKIRTGKLDANASSPDGAYPFFTCAKDPLRISSFSYDTECVLLAGNGNFDVNYFSGKFDAYQRTYILEARDRAELFIPFLYRFMQGHSRKLLEQSIGGVIKYIKIGFLTEAKFLLPQLDEQKMIVSKVDELMALCDQLELSLAERDELTKKISGAMAAEVAA
jgi:restriction endonuclease S subunit